MTVASEQNATVCTPSTLPTAASMPLSSSAVISSRLSASKSAASRLFGFRGSSSRGSLAGLAWAVSAAAGAWVMRSSGSSDGGERDGDVGAAEAERVVERHEVARRQVARLGRDVEVDGRVLLVEVD